MTGYLIAVEGQDGAGKGSVVAALVAALEERGYPTIPTAEPSKGPAGRLLRDVLDGRVEIDQTAMGPLFAADRADHVARVIRPLVEAGTLVVCDRYDMSNVVYRAAEISAPIFQCAHGSCGWRGDDEPPDLVGGDGSPRWGVWFCPACGRGSVWMSAEVIQRIMWASSLLVPPAPTPDLTIVLSLPTSVSQARIAARGRPADAYEISTTQQRCATLYRLADRVVRGRRLAIVDASGTKDAVAAAAINATVAAIDEIRRETR